MRSLTRDLGCFIFPAEKSSGQRELGDMSLRTFRSVSTPQIWAFFSRNLAVSSGTVPAGHHGSDLSSAACNIGLNRRRDITLRQDVRVEVNGRSCLLAEVFKVNILKNMLVSEINRVVAFKA